MRLKPKNGVPKTVWFIAIALILIAYIVYQRWQGPQLNGFIVAEAPLVQRVIAAGRVTNAERLQVTSELAGQVVARPVAEGNRVAQGETLLVLQAAELAAQLRAAQANLLALEQRQLPQAEAEVMQAETMLAQANRELKRREQLLAAELTTTETVEQARQARIAAQAALTSARAQLVSVQANGAEAQRLQAQIANLQAQLAKATIRAPAAGLILTRHFETGDVVQPGTLLFTIALDSAVEVRAPLDERNLPQLAIGQPAQLIADAYPSQPFAGTVSYIAPTIDAQRGTVEVRILISNPPAFLRQDMTVSVTIETARKTQALVVPNDALFARNDKQAQVWLVINGKAEARRVELGLSGLTLTEISAGVQRGDAVLLEAPQDLADGQRLRLQVQSLPIVSD